MKLSALIKELEEALHFNGDIVVVTRVEDIPEEFGVVKERVLCLEWLINK